MRTVGSFSSRLFSVVPATLVFAGVFVALGLWHAAGEFSQFRVEQKRRHSLSLAASAVHQSVEHHDFAVALAALEAARESARHDANSQSYRAALARELERPRPDEGRLRALSQGWERYQQNDILRLVDEHDHRSRQILLKVLIAWLAFCLGLALLAWRFLRAQARPITHLGAYFEGLDLSREVPPLFSSEDERARSGVSGAASEVQALVRGIEGMAARLREFRNVNLREVFVQKSRAEVLADASRDAVFFLQDDEIVWSNRVGAALLEAGPAGNLGLVETLRRSRRSWAPIRWSSGGEGGARQVFSFARCDRVRKDPALALEFDAVVAGQDITWLREVEEAKSDFIGLLSHEVKTPVTSLLMATRLLQRSEPEALTPLQRRLVESSVRDVERLRSLIDELFTASRFDLATAAMRFRSADLGRMLGQAVRSVQSEFDPRGVSIGLSRSLTRKSALVRADSFRLSWALTQLLSHLARHGRPGCHLEILLADESRHGRAGYRIFIRAERLLLRDGVDDRIFEKAFARYDTRVSKSDSTGMSLAFAREVVEGHHGTLVMDSGRDEGRVEITIWLPGEPAERSSVARGAAGTAERA